MTRAARDVVMGIGTIACSHLGGSESRQQDWKWGWDINSPPKPTQSGPTAPKRYHRLGPGIQTMSLWVTF